MDLNKPDANVISQAAGNQDANTKSADASEDLNYQGSFVASALRCRDLGWRLAAVDAREMVDLEVNFDEPAELWWRHCTRPGPLQGQVSLGVYTGSASGLLVLEVENGEGKSALDRCGSWRSACRACKNGRELHYYTAPRGTIFPLTRFLKPVQVMMYGEGGLAPLPPSVDVQTREAWRWSTPPWICPPSELPQGLLAFLQQDQRPGTAAAAPRQLLSWEEIYDLISPHEQVLKALLAPSRTHEEYYWELLETALKAGFRDQTFLLSLLWHAPQGDASRNPQRAAQFERMAREARMGSNLTAEPRDVSETPGPNQEQGILVTQSHYEMILAELKRLMEKAAELEAVLSSWGERLGAAGRIRENFVPELSPQKPREPAVEYQEAGQSVQRLAANLNESLGPQKKNVMPGSRLMSEGNDDDLWLHPYTELPPKVQEAPSPEVIEATINACLQKNPDLAKDPAKLQMVQYCFKNYVNIDPNLSDLSLLERLERASQMANEFLGGQN